MSAIETASEANRVIDTQYAAPVFLDEMVSGMWTGRPLVESSAETHYYRMWRRTRTFVASVRYIGLTREAAETLAASKAAAYKTTVAVQRWDETAGTMGDWVSDGTTEYRRATVVMRHAEGHMWDVVIDINEQTESWAKTKSALVNPTGDSWAYPDLEEED